MGCGASSESDAKAPATAAAPNATATGSSNAPAGEDPNAAHYAKIAQAGSALGTASTIVNAASAAATGALGALAQRNPDGSYTLKSSIGPVALSSPALKKILSHTLFGVSKVLEASDAGKVLVMVLQTCYNMYNCSAHKPQWFGEFTLYLKVQESELLEGKEQFRRQGFLSLVEKELRRVARKMEEIAHRSSVASFVFALPDQESLQASRVSIESMKAQALQGMAVEVAEGQTKMQLQLQGMLAKLEAEESSGVIQGEKEAGQELLASLRDVASKKLLMQLLHPIDFLADVESKSALFCPGTRRELFDAFNSWGAVKTLPAGVLKQDEFVERVFVLQAGAGMGKSTFAARLAAGQEGESIYATHFCNHALATRNDALAVVKSIVFQLAQRIPAYREWFLKALNAPSKESGGATLKERLAKNKVTGGARAFFVEYIVKGLCAVNAQAESARRCAPSAEEGSAAANAILPLCVSGGARSQVVVQTKEGRTILTPAVSPRKMMLLIDSLDESITVNNTSSASDSAQQEPDDLVRIISDNALLSKLPPWVGFIVTSRPEARIEKALRHYKSFHLSTESTSNSSDLQLYLRATLASLVDSDDLESAVSILLAKSDGLFLYARSVVDSPPAFVSEGGVRLTLEQIKQFPEGMGQQYLSMLQRVRAHFAPSEGEQAPKEEGKNFAHVTALLRVVLAAYEPLSVAQLAGILKLPVAVVHQLLLPLRPLLPLRAEKFSAPSTPSSSDSPAAADPASPRPDHAVVTLLHQSVRDFLTDPQRKVSSEEVEFYVDVAQGHALLHRECSAVLFVDPPLPVAVAAAGKKLSAASTAAAAAPSASKDFPLLRVAEVLSASHEGLEHYALHYASLHALVAGDIDSWRSLLCSLQFIALKVERNQSGELMRDLNAALRMMDVKPGRGSSPVAASGSADRASSPPLRAVVPKAHPGDIALFRAMKRFLQAELRHLTHGFSHEAQAKLVFQYAASYPQDHVACVQANQPNLRKLWHEIPAASSQHPLSVDHVLWANKPLALDATIKAWTELGEALCSLAYHPVHASHRLVAGGAQGSVSVYNTQSGECVRAWKGAHKGRTTAVAFLHDGELLASAGEDGRIHAWSLTNQQGDDPLASLPYDHGSSDDEEDPLQKTKPGPITSLAFSSDANSSYLFAGSSDGGVYVYSRKDLRLLTVLKAATTGAQVSSVAYSHDRAARTSSNMHACTPQRGFLVAGSSDGLVRVWTWDPLRGEVVGEARTLPTHAGNGAVESVSISFDNKLVAAGTRDGFVLVHDLALSSAPPRKFEGHTGAVFCVDFSSSANMEIASCSADETVRLWNVSSGTTNAVLRGHHLDVRAVAFSPSNRRVASASLDESIRVWDAEASSSPAAAAAVGAKPAAAATKHSHAWNVSSVSFSADGGRILSTSEDKILRTWDARTGALEVAVENLPCVAHHLAVGEKNGEDFIVMASRDSNEITTYAQGKQVASFDSGVRVLSFALNKPGTHLVFATADKRVNVLSVGAGGQALTQGQGWNAPTQLEQDVRSVIFAKDDSTDEVLVALASDEVLVVSKGVVSGSSVRREGASAGFKNVAASLSPFDTRTMVASSDASGHVRVWDRSTGIVRATMSASWCGGVHLIHWRSPSQLLLATTGTHAVLLWDWEKNLLTLQLAGHDDTITTLASHGSKLVSGSLDNRIVVWDMQHVPAPVADAAADAAPAVAVADAPLPSVLSPLHSFLFESERAAATGSLHLYTCYPGAHRLSGTHTPAPTLQLPK